jgi:hypothetical protein
MLLWTGIAPLKPRHAAALAFMAAQRSGPFAEIVNR